MKGGIITKVKNIFSYALFGVVCLLALINTFYRTEYVSNIAKAAIVPLFLIGIIDFMYKIKDKAEQILLEKISASHADYREAKAIYDSIVPFEDVDTDGKVQAWKEEMERKSEICVKNHLLSIQVEKMFKWYLPVYTIFSLLLFLSMLFAQAHNWILFLAAFNSDTITLWTFAILLLDVSFTDFFANRLISFVDRKMETTSTKGSS